MKELTRTELTERDQILFHDQYSPENYLGGIRRFQDIDGESLRRLILLGYANPADRLGVSPSIEEFCQFLLEHPSFTCHGYAVSSRDDDRISVEGLYTSSFNDKDTEDFYFFSESADDIRDSDVYLYSCWA